MPPRRQHPASVRGIILAWVLGIAGAPYALAQTSEYNGAALRQQLLVALSDRLDIMRDIAAHKWENNAPITVIERELVVLARVGEQALALGMDPDDAQQMYRTMFALSKNVQTFWHEVWRRSGYTETGKDRRSLTQIRHRLNAIDSGILQTLYRLLPALRSDHASYGARLDLSQLARYPVDVQQLHRLSDRLAQVRWLPYGQPGRVLNRIKASNLLRVGTTGDYPPFSHYETHRGYTGFDIEMARLLAAALTVDLVFVPTTWPTLAEDLKAQKFDIAMSGISIHPDRQRFATFSDAYHHGGKGAIGRCADRARFSRWSAIDSPNVRLIVNPGGTNMALVRDQVVHAEVLVHDDNLTIFEQIIADTADVMVTDMVEIALMEQRYPDQLCGLLRKPIKRYNKAYMVAQNTDLAQEVNIVLERLRYSGQLDTLMADALARAAYQ